MTTRKKHLIALSTVFAALIVGVGCGGGSDGSTIPLVGASAHPRSEANSETPAASAKKRSGTEAVDQTSDKGSHPHAATKATIKHDRPHGQGKRSDYQSQSTDDIAKRVRKLAQGAGGVQVVESRRAIKTIIHHIQHRVRQKHSHEDPSDEGDVAEVLGELGN